MHYLLCIQMLEQIQYLEDSLVITTSAVILVTQIAGLNVLLFTVYAHTAYTVIQKNIIPP